MQKISSKDAAALLKQAGAAIRTLTSENAKLLEELDGIRRDQRIDKIAEDMEDKGLNQELTREQKIASLREANLDVAEEAIKMAAPQSNFFGHVSEDELGGGAHPFETYIITGEADE